MPRNNDTNFLQQVHASCLLSPSGQVVKPRAAPAALRLCGSDLLRLLLASKDLEGGVDADAPAPQHQKDDLRATRDCGHNSSSAGVC